MLTYMDFIRAHIPMHEWPVEFALEHDIKGFNNNCMDNAFIDDVFLADFCWKLPNGRTAYICAEWKVVHGSLVREQWWADESLPLEKYSSYVYDGTWEQLVRVVESLV
jgi:hypothetical protein